MPTVSLHISTHLHKVVNADSTTTKRGGAGDFEETILPSVLQTPAGLALVEIQGKINVTGIDNDGAAISVGKLVFPLYDPSSPTAGQAWMKTVYLYVGKHQRLTGEAKKLPKAIGILRKHDSESSGVETKQIREEHLEIIEILEWKILFSNRPEPMGE